MTRLKYNIDNDRTSPRSPLTAVMSYMSFFLLTAALAFVSVSCVRTSDSDLEDCEYPLRLKFTYTYNRENRDLFAEEVPCVALRLYDERGNLVKASDIDASEIAPDGSFEWKAPTGVFTLVTWGGVQTRYRLDDHRGLHEATLSMPDTDSHVNQTMEHLWHNVTPDILINGTVTPEYVIDTRKLSNDVYVHLYSATGEALQHDSQAYITATNNIYGFSGEIDGRAYPVTYHPLSDTQSTSRHTHLFTTLGLSRYDNSTLSVQYGDTPVYSGPLTELIARQPDIIFDLDDEFNIDFALGAEHNGNISVSISVNGWHVHDLNITLK